MLLKSTIIQHTISNIYFDTPDDYLIRTSLSRPEYKEKLRLRAYGVPSSDSKVFLEIKKKFNGIVNKRRTKLKLAEAYSFIVIGKAPDLKYYEWLWKRSKNAVSIKTALFFG